VSLQILIDTNTYSAYKRGSVEALEVVRNADLIGFPIIVVGELLTGFVGGSRTQQNRSELEQFMASPRVRVIALTLQTAEVYAQISNRLRTKGRSIPTNDIWIAALAIEQGYALWTLDEHFSAIEGLEVGRTLAELQG